MHPTHYLPSVAPLGPRSRIGYGRTLVHRERRYSAIPENSVPPVARLAADLALAFVRDRLLVSELDIVWVAAASPFRQGEPWGWTPAVDPRRFHLVANGPDAYTDRNICAFRHFLETALHEARHCFQHLCPDFDSQDTERDAGEWSAAAGRILHDQPQPGDERRIIPACGERH